jgi:hypothetical protein
MVQDAARERGIPVVVTMAGCYGGYMRDHHGGACANRRHSLTPFARRLKNPILQSNP